MNTLSRNPQAIVAEALQKGWISFRPSEPPRYIEKQRERFREAGLTIRGTPRKRRDMNPDVLAAAKRDGVSIGAFYMRLKRTGKMTR